MKMRVSILAFALLSVSILSYGMSGSAFAANSFITASTNSEVIGNGGTVTLSGTIEDYDATAGHGLTFVITSPDNNIVGIGQISVKSDGSFEKSVVAGGPLWKLAGDYTVNFNFGPTSGDVIINYVGGEQVISDQPPVDDEPDVPPPPPPPPVDDEPDVPPPPPPPPVDDEPVPITCGPGTEMVDGICKVKSEPKCPEGYSFQGDVCVEDKGGCLIATAAYGTELAPQIQLLREVRDNTVLSTASGSAFMTGFNTVYYSFAPTVADWERENPMFKESVRAFITPMISTLSIMTLAEDGSEAEVLGLGMSVIALNLAMYIAAPALIGFKVHKSLKSRK